MLKLMGAVLIVISGCVWGFLESDKLKRRCEVLQKIISGLVLLENEISYGKRDIKTVLMSIGEIQGAEIFKNAAGYAESYGIRESFEKAIEKEKYILGTDKEVVKILSEKLGMTDAKAQIKSIRHAKGLLDLALESALQEFEKSGKLYKAAGALGGICVVILLL